MWANQRANRESIKVKTRTKWLKVISIMNIRILNELDERKGGKACDITAATACHLDEDSQSCMATAGNRGAYVKSQKHQRYIFVPCH